MSRCQDCSYGSSPDPMSAVCDGCRNDADTGWGGFTDHSIGKHFNSDEEANEYYESHSFDDEEDEDY